MVQGKTAEAELNMRRAADGRHPPFIITFALPASHIAWPEGTIMISSANPGEAEAASAADTANIIGVLDTRVAADEQSGNVMVHGSCAADILKCVDGGALADAAAEQIAALQGKAIYA